MSSGEESDVDMPVAGGVSVQYRPPQSIEECYALVDYSGMGLVASRMATTNKQHQDALKHGDQAITQVLKMLTDQRANLSQGENVQPANIQSINQLIDKVTDAYAKHRQAQSKLKAEQSALEEAAQMGQDGEIDSRFDWSTMLTEGRNKFLMHPSNQQAEAKDIEDFKLRTAFVPPQRNRGRRSVAAAADGEEEGEPGEEGEPSDLKDEQEGEQSEEEGEQLILPISQSQSFVQSPQVKRERRAR